MAAESCCVWLYAVTDEETHLLPEDLIGVDAGRVRPLRAAGLTAIVGDVDHREFGEAALRRNLEDLGWLEETARAHHAVVAALARQRPTVPMRLATVYTSDANVIEMLRDRAADFRAALSRLTACSEWGVKALAAAPRDQGWSSGSTAGRQDDPATGPGAAYLRRRRAQLAAHKDARREASASARDLHEKLSRLAVTARLYPPQAPDLAAQAAPMVLNAAYLVADRHTDAFAAAVTELNGNYPSVQLILTGPWPAYSFVTTSEGTDR
jgi:Gas vesicle synthesis protein GvpL/GvpF